MINCIQKVGVVLTNKEIAEKVFDTVGDIAKTADFVLAGLTNYDVAKLCNQGHLERIRNGFYCLPDNDEIKDELCILKLVPLGIISVESAFNFYGYSSIIPERWSITVPRSFSRAIKKVDAFPLKAYCVPKEYHLLGAVMADFNGITLKVYDRERTICDCVKHRKKLGEDLYNTVINAYLADENKNLNNIPKYAQEMQIYPRVMRALGHIFEL